MCSYRAAIRLCVGWRPRRLWWARRLWRGHLVLCSFPLALKLCFAYVQKKKKLQFFLVTLYLI
jgi:hypothetical protein